MEIYVHYKSINSNSKTKANSKQSLFTNHKCAFHKCKLQSLMLLVVIEFIFRYNNGGKPVFSIHRVTVYVKFYKVTVQYVHVNTGLSVHSNAACGLGALRRARRALLMTLGVEKSLSTCTLADDAVMLKNYHCPPSRPGPLSRWFHRNGNWTLKNRTCCFTNAVK